MAKKPAKIEAMAELDFIRLVEDAATEVIDGLASPMDPNDAAVLAGLVGAQVYEALASMGAIVLAPAAISATPYLVASSA